jgi:phosphoglycerate dehydrogenase-like enzyme
MRLPASVVLLALSVVLACSAPQQAPSAPSAEEGPVAIATEDGRVPLVFLAGALDPQDLADLERSCPNLTVHAGLSRTDALALAPQAHGIDGRFCSSEMLQAAPELVWVQAGSAGVERYLRVPELVGREEIVLTNMRGAASSAIADHAFAMLLALTRRLEPRMAAAREGRWQRELDGPDPVALEERTMLVLGLGAIGTEIARRADGFGMRVVATRRSDRPSPDFVDRVERPERTLELLAEADVVAVCLPLTDETEELLDAEAFTAMKPGAFLVNVARGRIVDHDALLAALESGHLAGACLDVTEPEPLPADHPLWRRPDVLITPHVAGRAALSSGRWNAMYLENLRRFAAGEPLLNVVDKAAGY